MLVRQVMLVHPCLMLSNSKQVPHQESCLRLSRTSVVGELGITFKM